MKKNGAERAVTLSMPVGDRCVGPGISGPGSVECTKPQAPPIPETGDSGDELVAETGITS